MKKLIFLITLMLFISTNIQAASEAEINKCLNKYSKVAGVTKKAGIGAGAAAGAGLVGGIGGAIIGGVVFHSLAAIILAPPIGAALIVLGGITAAVVLPIMKSYKMSYEVLDGAAQFHKKNIVHADFQKVFKRRDRRNKSKLLSLQRQLFTDKSMKKWCTHPLYDYLTLKRKIRNGSIYGK